MQDKYKEELLFRVFSYYQSDLKYFNLLKAEITSPEELQDSIERIATENEDLNFVAKVLYQEEQFERLMEMIEQKHKISWLEEYDKKLKKYYPERVIKVYTDYIMPEMDRANDRKRYKALVQYLKKIAKCPNGKDQAQAIADEWQQTYKRRSALRDELKRAGF